MTQPVDILENLNPEQRAAVTSTNRLLLVNAGAGTGKTRVITHRIAHLIREREVHPWQIFASTFTNKAAEEMKRRVDGLLPGFEAARITVGTFHSICVSILRNEASHAGLGPRFTIADDSDQKALVKDILKTMEVPKSLLEPRTVLSNIAFAKIKMLTPADVREQLAGEWGEEAVEAYEKYEERLARNNAVDFDDLLLKVVYMFRDQPEVLAPYHERWRHFMVDEYQDINKVQFELIRLLVGDKGSLCAVGDEDQSIYSWRGAEVDNIIDFPDQFGETEIVRLEQNYRSTESILSAANSVIANNARRLGKRLWSGRGAGEPLSIITGASEREEAALVIDAVRRMHSMLGVAYRKFAVFYRVNALSRLFEDYLRELEIPYRIVGGVRFYDRAEIKDLMCYLRLIVNPMDGIGLARVINKPRRGIGEKTLRQLESGAAAGNLSLWHRLEAAVGDKDMPKKARAGVTDLVSMIHRWRKMNEDGSNPKELLEAVLRDTRYEQSLGDPDSLETLTRIENIEELRHALSDYSNDFPDAGLDDYIERITLAAAVDSMQEEDDVVSLMTLHSAKGLEFPIVFLTGLEESIFPSPRSLDEQGNYEEERRLFYVGVTRAQDRLFLCRADSRTLYGRTQYNPPSVFLQEVPEELTQSLGDARRGWDTDNPATDGGGKDFTTEPPKRSVMAGEYGGRSTLAESPRVPEGARSGGARGRTSGADRINEIEESSEVGLFSPGTRIRHSTLGEGEVVSARGSGAKRKISIRFDAGLELEVLEQYGGLEIVEDLPF